MNTAKDEPKIRAIIDSVTRPDFVTEVRFRLDYDWAGDPAVMGWILVRDPEKMNVAYEDKARQFRDAVNQAIRDSEMGYWPYLEWILDSAQRELDAEEDRERAHQERRKKKVPVAL